MTCYCKECQEKKEKKNKYEGNDMVCPNPDCGGEWSCQAKFCGHCGTKLIKNETKVI